MSEADDTERRKLDEIKESEADVNPASKLATDDSEKKR